MPFWPLYKVLTRCLLVSGWTAGFYVPAHSVMSSSRHTRYLSVTYPMRIGVRRQAYGVEGDSGVPSIREPTDAVTFPRIKRPQHETNNSVSSVSR